MHRKNELVLVLSISLMGIMIAGAFMIPFGKATFNTFEQYGPRVDQLLMKLYANQQVEFQDLELGAIDMVDWPLDAYWINRWTTDPNIVMQDYGGEIGMREFDINVNETRGICSAAGTDRTQMQPNIGTNLAFRQAVAYLVDRAYVISSILGGFGTPQYTFVPAALGSYVNNNVNKYLYSPTAAAAVLAAGDIHDTDGDGYFDWPGTADGASNRIIVDFVVRIDDTPGRNEAGKRLIWEMATNIRAHSGGVGFYVQEWDASGSVGARKWWMDGKGAVIYTGGWSLSRDTDFLYDLFHGTMYWDPGRPPNVAHVDDPVLNAYLEGIKFGENAASVMQNTQDAQARMADMAWVVPVWVASAPKAVRAQYTGGTNEAPVNPDDGENQYRGKDWQAYSNNFGNGFNSFMSTQGAHVNDANGVPMLGGVMRYGFKVSEINSFNPVYSEWVWDWEILGRTYDSMLAVNPYDLSEDLEWVAKRWEVGVWSGPFGEATRLVFQLRNDVFWHDGQQLDADDLVFTMQDLVSILLSRDLPPPWYYGALLDVNSITKVDQFTIEVRMNSKSYFALHWIAGNIILPEHIWRDIVTNGDPTGFAPDPQIIGTGPYKAYPHSIDLTAGDYYVPQQYVKLDANHDYFRYGPDLEYAAWQQKNQANPTNTLVIWKLNLAPIPVAFEKYIVVKSGANYYWYDFGPDGLSETGDDGGWVLGGIPSSPPTPPAGVDPWKAVKPANTAPGNVPGIAHTKLPLPPAQASVVYGIERSRYAISAAWNYDWQVEEHLSPQPSRQVVGDINADGFVNVLDAISLSFHFGLKAYVWIEADINVDVKIDTLDALILIENWGM